MAAVEPFTTERPQVSESRRYQCREPHSFRPIFIGRLVLLLGIFTCVLFFSAWVIVEAVFVRKIKPDSKGLMFVIIAIAGSYVGGFINGFISALNHTNPQPLGHLITINSPWSIWWELSRCGVIWRSTTTESNQSISSSAEC